MFIRALMYSIIVSCCVFSGTIFAAAAKEKSEKEAFVKYQHVQFTLPGEKAQEGFIDDTFTGAFGNNATVWSKKGNIAVCMYLYRIGWNPEKPTFESPLTQSNEIFYVKDAERRGHIVHKNWMKCMPAEANK